MTRSNSLGSNQNSWQDAQTSMVTLSFSTATGSPHIQLAQIGQKRPRTPSPALACSSRLSRVRTGNSVFRRVGRGKAIPQHALHGHDGPPAVVEYESRFVQLGQTNMEGRAYVITVALGAYFSL